MMTLEQQRADAAWRFAQEGVALSDQYKDLAKATPALIMNNGLMQTLAFFEHKGKAHHLTLATTHPGEVKQRIEDKGKAHYLTLATHLRRWVMTRAGGTDKDIGFRPFMEILLKADSQQYRQATEEALLLLRWLRQFAAAVGA